MSSFGHHDSKRIVQLLTLHGKILGEARHTVKWGLFQVMKSKGRHKYSFNYIKGCSMEVGSKPFSSIGQERTEKNLSEGFRLSIRSGSYKGRMCAQF